MGKRRDVLGQDSKLRIQDEIVGANPETCWHRVLWLAFGPDWHFVCVSCRSCLDDELLNRRDYKYDEKHDVFVQVGRTRKK